MHPELTRLQATHRIAELERDASRLARRRQLPTRASRTPQLARLIRWLPLAVDADAIIIERTPTPGGSL